MLVTSDEGQFFYKSTDDESTVCGIYMITDPGKRIEMIIVYMDVPCEAEGLIAVRIPSANIYTCQMYTQLLQNR